MVFRRRSELQLLLLRRVRVRGRRERNAPPRIARRLRLTLDLECRGLQLEEGTVA
jgi:hypothetical protein